MVDKSLQISRQVKASRFVSIICYNISNIWNEVNCHLLKRNYTLNAHLNFIKLNVTPHFRNFGS